MTTDLTKDEFRALTPEQAAEVLNLAPVRLYMRADIVERILPSTDRRSVMFKEQWRRWAHGETIMPPAVEAVRRWDQIVDAAQGTE